MENFLGVSISSFLAFLLISVSCTTHSTPIDGDSKVDGASTLRTYIIRVRLPENMTVARAKDLEDWYRSFLPHDAAGSAEPRLVYAYSDAITGFAAKLTEEEVKHMEKEEGFLKAYPDRVLPLLTTHTPTFLGLNSRDGGVWTRSGMGKGVVIGMLDSGITAGHRSFGDDGVPSPPSKWKGACDLKETKYCNNKLIGARSFIGPVDPRHQDPIDSIGHGTHTASTAAGNFVKNANVLGNANGTGAGIAPLAHLAIYKVCNLIGCFDSDILAAMDAAIKEGVDVLSISLGADSQPFYSDVVAIGAFSAMAKGVFVSCAGGNSGPWDGTLTNEAPWILTVGASTIDRNIRATVKLANGREFDGESAYQPAGNFSSTMLPLVHYEYKSASFGGQASDVTGKIAVCRVQLGSGIDIGEVVKRAGGAALVLLNDDIDGYTTLAEAHHLPASQLNYVDGSEILSYINSTAKPAASIVFKGTLLGTSPAPTVAAFSSRGPSRASAGVLKPDVTGPGVNILAAWPVPVGPGLTANDRREAHFNMVSGTSMSTPHLSGVAALVKSAHPDWSPAAIKSAIMTTSEIMDRAGQPIKDEKLRPASFYAMGAGHVNPSRAVDPGLVYDLGAEEYTAYLCGIGYTDWEVELVTNRKIKCAELKKIDESQLNYPSISLSLGAEQVAVNRTATNVGDASSTYVAKVDMPEGVLVTVTPETPRFKELHEKKSFTVSLVRRQNKTGHVQGNLWWVSDKHRVRSPIVVT